MENLLPLMSDMCVPSAFQHRMPVMNKFAEEFRDLLSSYVRLTSDLTRIADAGQSDEDPQALIQSVLDNRSCFTEIQQLNERLTKLYGVWKDKEADFTPGSVDEVRNAVDDVRDQMRQLEELCKLGSQKVEARRKQLSGELTKVGKGSRYLKLLNPVQENYPKFIDSAC